MTASTTQASAQFTCRIHIDAENQAIYVDSTTYSGGSILSFGTFREQVAALRSLAQTHQVIVPKESDLEVAGFQTELKIRSNKLTAHEKLARRYAALTTRIPSKRFFKDECNEADVKRYQEALTQGRRFSDAHLKVEIVTLERRRKKLSMQLDRIAQKALEEEALAPAMDTEAFLADANAA